MSKRNSTILILLITILIFGGLFYFYFQNVGTPTTQTQNTFTPNTSNPFGNNTINTTTGTTQTATTSSQSQTAIKNTAKLIQIYKNPTSGSVFFSNNNKDTLRFVDRANGNVYEYIPDIQTGQATRLTNTTIPKIQETVWSAVGKNLFLRYLDEAGNIASFAGLVNVSSSTDGSLGNISGTFATVNMKQLVVNPKGDRAFGLLTSGSGSTGITFDLNGANKKQAFTSPVALWNISWPTTNIITFTNKPSFKDTGYLFFYNVQTGSFDRILGDTLGLSTITNNDGTLVAYSGNQNSSFNLDIYDVKNKNREGYKISTLAEKCVWGNTNNAVLYCAVPQIIPEDSYPDAWYQGLESFSDSIWSIDTKSGTTKLIYQIGSNESSVIDGIDLHMSPTDNYMALTNKGDLSLWLLEVGN